MRTEYQFRYEPSNDKLFGRLFKGALAVWAVAVLGSLAVGIGLLYVAIHFIAKYW